MKNLFIYKLLIVILMATVWAYFYNILPNSMPIHWWFDWKPDRMWSKLMWVIMLPLLALWMAVLFHFLQRFDPKKENYAKFWNIWEIIQFSILWFFAYIYFVSIFVTLSPEYNISKFMMIWIWVLFMILWNYMWKVRQNYFIGYKLPWTLANEEVWNKTHRLWGKMFLLAGFMFIVNAFFLRQALWVFIVAISLILIVPIVYSYSIFKKIKK